MASGEKYDRLEDTTTTGQFDSLSRKHLHTKVTPDFHLTYSKNGGNLGSESNDKNGLISIFLHKIICCGRVLESPH